MSDSKRITNVVGNEPVTIHIQPLTIWNGIRFGLGLTLGGFFGLSIIALLLHIQKLVGLS